jgi:hypothetical protein
MVDLGTQFCERCGRDRDTVTSARGAYRDCPRCGAACCADCWNLVDGACLKCAPFRLTEPPAARWVVVAPAAGKGGAGGGVGAVVGGAWPKADPYRDLRAEPRVDQPAVERRTAWQQPARRPAAEQDTDVPEARQREPRPTATQPIAATAPAATTAPAARSRPRRRAGRIGLAAATAWVVVAALAVAALGASPGRAPATLETPSVEAPPPNEIRR